MVWIHPQEIKERLARKAKGVKGVGITDIAVALLLGAYLLPIALLKWLNQTYTPVNGTSYATSAGWSSGIITIYESIPEIALVVILIGFIYLYVVRDR